MSDEIKTGGDIDRELLEQARIENALGEELTDEQRQVGRRAGGAARRGFALGACALSGLNGDPEVARFRAAKWCCRCESAARVEGGGFTRLAFAACTRGLPGRPSALADRRLPL